jgi:hypothetical protein
MEKRKFLLTKRRMTHEERAPSLWLADLLQAHGQNHYDI